MNNFLHVRNTSGHVSTQALMGDRPPCSVNMLLHAWHFQVINELYSTYPRTITTIQHVLLLTENKRKLCTHATNNCTACDYLYSLAYSYAYIPDV